jgi:hypothetical protein
VNNLPDDVVTPDDHVSCEPGALLNFTFARTRRISLARTSWACWGGRIGNGGELPRFSSAPQAPLWQQATFRGDSRPCEYARPTALSARSVSSVHGEVTATRQDAPSARTSDHRTGGDPLVDAFAHCGDWYQPPTQPGIVVVACDQEQLDRYVASGLTDPGRGGARLSGPGGAANGVPSVYANDDAAALDRVGVTGGGTAAGVYVSRLAHDGGCMRRPSRPPSCRRARRFACGSTRTSPSWCAPRTGR